MGGKFIYHQVHVDAEMFVHVQKKEKKKINIPSTYMYKCSPYMPDFL